MAPCCSSCCYWPLGYSHLLLERRKGTGPTSFRDRRVERRRHDCEIHSSVGASGGCSLDVAPSLDAHPRCRRRLCLWSGISSLFSFRSRQAAVILGLEAQEVDESGVSFSSRIFSRQSGGTVLLTSPSARAGVGET